MHLDPHALLAQHGVSAAHLAAVESAVASGRLSFGQLAGLLLKYKDSIPAVLTALASVYGAIAGGKALDLPTLLGILQMLQSPAAKEILTAILGLLKIPVPAGF